MARRTFWRRFRQLTGGPIAPALPVVNPLQTVNPVYLLLQLQPVVRHGIRELDNSTTQHVILETTMMAYLMGVGYDYRTARAIVESWEIDDTCDSDYPIVEKFVLAGRNEDVKVDKAEKAEKTEKAVKTEKVDEEDKLISNRGNL